MKRPSHGYRALLVEEETCAWQITRFKSKSNVLSIQVNSQVFITVDGHNEQSCRNAEKTLRVTSQLGLWPYCLLLNTDRQRTCEMLLLLLIESVWSVFAASLHMSTWHWTDNWFTWKWHEWETRRGKESSQEPDRKRQTGKIRTKRRVFCFSSCAHCDSPVGSHCVTVVVLSSHEWEMWLLKPL